MRHLKAYENQIFASLKMFSILASLFDFFKYFNSRDSTLVVG